MNFITAKIGTSAVWLRIGNVRDSSKVVRAAGVRLGLGNAGLGFVVVAHEPGEMRWQAAGAPLAVDAALGLAP